MKTILIIIVTVIAIILGLSFFLSPNDLASCKDTPSDAVKCRKADAIVAISGGDTAARANEAIRLYQQGWASKLIFSGAAQDKSGPSNAEVMRQTALDVGVPAANIITEEEGETTKQNAENTQNIFQQNDITSVILVTSGYHQRRASLEFNKRSGDTVQVRNHPVATDNQWSNVWWITPTGWYLAVTEFVKIIVFYAGGTR
ncbi:MAG TPA: YdcF family protein [Candidatus Saccharimonadales bacterium]